MVISLTYIVSIQDTRLMPIMVKVGDIMTQGIISVGLHDSVWDAVDVMLKHNIGSVLVTKDGEYVGIITERDVMRKVTINALDPKTIEAERIMSSPLVTVEANGSLGGAALLMIEKRIRRLPVVEGGKIIGIVTERDLNNATLNTMISLGRV